MKSSLGKIYNSKINRLKLKKYFFPVVILMTLLFSKVIQAQTQVETQLNQSSSKWNHTLTTSSSVNRKKDSIDQSATLEASYSANYKVNKNYNLRGSLALNKSFNNNEERFEFGNARVGLRKNFSSVNFIHELAKWRPEASLILPTNTYAADIQTFRGGVSGAATLLLPYRKFTFYVTQSAAWYTHQYRVQKRGGINQQARFAQGLTVTYPVNQKILLSFNQGLVQTKSYKNNISNGFAMAQSISYQHDTSLSASLGHTNNTSLYKANGVSLNASIYDPKTSILFASLNYTL